MNKTETELREIIRQRCIEAGRTAVAKDLGIDTPYLSMIVRPNNPRGISPAIAERLGYKRERATTTLFVPKNNYQEALT